MGECQSTCDTTAIAVESNAPLSVPANYTGGYPAFEDESDTESVSIPFKNLERIWSLFATRSTQDVKRKDFEKALIRVGVSLEGSEQEETLWTILDIRKVGVIYFEDFKGVVPRNLSLTEFAAWCKTRATFDVTRSDQVAGGKKYLQPPESFTEKNAPITELQAQIRRKYPKLTELLSLRFARSCAQDRRPMDSADTEISKFYEYFEDKNIPEDMVWTYVNLYNRVNLIAFPEHKKALEICNIYLYGHDRCGRPVSYIDFSASKLNQFKHHEDIVCEACIRTQLLLQSMQERTSETRGYSQYQTIFIIDVDNMKGLGPLKFRPMMGALMRVLDTLSYLFPNSTAQNFIINSSGSIRAVFSILKNWVRDTTANTTKFLGKNYLSQLVQEIELNQIPVKFGGTSTALPVVGSYTEPVDTWKDRKR